MEKALSAHSLTSDFMHTAQTNRDESTPLWLTGGPLRGDFPPIATVEREGQIYRASLAKGNNRADETLVGVGGAAARLWRPGPFLPCSTEQGHRGQRASPASNRHTASLRPWTFPGFCSRPPAFYLCPGGLLLGGGGGVRGGGGASSASIVPPRATFLRSMTMFQRSGMVFRQAQHNARRK